MKKTIDLTRPLADLLKEHGACSEGFQWAREAGLSTAAEAWEVCLNAEWMTWALEQIGYHNPPALRRFACRCVRETPLADGRTSWDLLIDQRSRNAVEVAERFADGLATTADLSAAWAAGSAAWAAGSAAWADLSAVGAAAGAATWAAGDAAAWAAGAAARAARAAAAWAAGDAAAWAAGAAAWDAARAAQARILRECVGNPFVVEAGDG